MDSQTMLHGSALVHQRLINGIKEINYDILKEFNYNIIKEISHNIIKEISYNIIYEKKAQRLNTHQVAHDTGII